MKLLYLLATDHIYGFSIILKITGRYLPKLLIYLRDFAVETRCVFCEVGTECLNIISIGFMI
jgi:hypothetical protein